MRRNEMHGAAIPAMDISKLGIADADGIFEHSGKHRLKIAWRAADNLEHLRRGRLLLQCLFGLVEETRVLDRDHRLVGEGLEQGYFLLSEGCVCGT